MVTYKTPNVYVEEISKFPPSVAEVSTAVPAFIGYTEKAKRGSEDLTNKPTRISSLLDYETLFGEAGATKFEFTANEDGIEPISNPGQPKYLMYYALRLYFDNGGGSCYIVSVGKYNGNKKKDDFDKGLSVLEKEDEPTLILLTDAVNLETETDYYDLCQQALMQCHKLKDRFAILDVLPNNTSTKEAGDNFRNNLKESEVDYLKYGAAYYPYLQTSLNYYSTDVSVKESPDTDIDISFEYIQADSIRVTYTGKEEDEPKVNITQEENQTKDIDFSFDPSGQTLTIKLKKNNETVSNILTEWETWKNNADNSNGHSFNIIGINNNGTVNIFTASPPEPLKPLALKPLSVKVYNTSPNGILAAYVGPEEDEPKVVINVEQTQTEDVKFEVNNTTLTINIKDKKASVKTITDAWKADITNNSGNFQIKKNGDGSADISSKLEETKLTVPPTLTYYKTTKTDLYNKIKAEIAKQRVVLPPSPAIAGVYARVDRDRGVWKAPANVSLASVLAPTEKITNEEQEDLNIDPTAGKSINAIRSFTGKGILVWGARTLAGNDNEWKYIPVRRLFNLIEESIQKATAFVVFESNNAITWLKVQSLIESYLEGLWRQGALAGSTPEQAFFVHIGLGKTMTAQDIVDGRMIVEIGLAAVRPAEFIILKFSHKLQEV